ncbi:hypothetical protein ACFOLJ_20395 [Rugamonas sp. CCM 8940]|uniref:hypothetical protein n=1 Tax=Rugamonas sp. CCM 8940 TaxID=2765359 RepID=UPI0018F31735|nr:hypothetical protein [Rugamonas sp. CCM 8940]MBJ7309030.1 hypothetical protein [Rugamonas sp. CCM 8940]
MKMTIVTDDRGNLLGAVQGHSLTQRDGDIEAGVNFAAGHQLHYVDVDDDMATVTDAGTFQQRLIQHLPKP